MNELKKARHIRRPFLKNAEADVQGIDGQVYNAGGWIDVMNEKIMTV
jgi:hypothetical protein